MDLWLGLWIQSRATEKEIPRENTLSVLNTCIYFLCYFSLSKQNLMAISTIFIVRGFIRHLELVEDRWKICINFMQI